MSAVRRVVPNQAGRPLNFSQAAGRSYAAPQVAAAPQGTPMGYVQQARVQTREPAAPQQPQHAHMVPQGQQRRVPPQVAPQQPRPVPQQPRPQPRRTPGVVQAKPADFMIGYAVEVTSGDAIRIRYFEQVNGTYEHQKDEKALIIDQIQAPKTARRPHQDEDAFGWEAKEFLRSKLICTPRRHIAFKISAGFPKAGGAPVPADQVEQPVEEPSNKPVNPRNRALPPRYFAEVLLLDQGGDPSKNINLAELMASEGYATVKELRRDRFKGRAMQDKTLTESEVMSKTEEEIIAHYDDTNPEITDAAEKGRYSSFDIRYKRLKAQELAAEDARKGKHSGASFEKSIRDVEWILNRRDDRDKARKFFEATRNRSVEAIVSEVREGTLVHLEIIPDEQSKDQKHRMVFVNIYGIKSPSIPLPHHVALANWTSNKDKSRPKPKEADHVPEKFAIEAQRHTEERLLCQRVWLDLKQCDQRGVMYGDIVLIVNGQRRNIAASLVKKGYACVVNWQSAGREDLLRAQQEAIKARQGVWSLSPEERAAIKSLPLPRAETVGENGRVVEIRNGDCIRVEMDKDKSIRDVYLASIRSYHKNFTPNMDAAGRGFQGGRRDRETMYKAVNAAKEWLRRKSIGERVVLEWEYDRELQARPPANGGKGLPGETRKYYSVILLNKNGQKMPGGNLARDLVEAGLAKTMDYDRNKTERSKYYEELTEASQKAQEAKVGYFHPGHKEKQLMDLSISFGPELEKCKMQRMSLWTALGQNKAGIDADVEFVFGGHKIKVVIDVQKLPKYALNKPRIVQESIKKYPRRAVALFLEGIECTRAGKGKDPSKWSEVETLNERVSTWAKQFVERMINQRTVQAHFTKQDNTKNFLGYLTVRNSAKLSLVWYEVGQDGKPERREGLLASEKGRLNVSEMLLRRGLAKCRMNLRPTDDGAKALFDAEAEAKEKKLGYWRFTTVKKPEPVQGQKEEPVVKQEVKEDTNVRITHVTDGANLYAVPETERNAKQMKEIEAALAGFPNKGLVKPKPEWDPKERIFYKPMVVAGRFQGGYYRCRIINTQRVDGKPDIYTVHFLDYGNEAVLNYSDIEYLPENLKGRELAQPIRLAYLKAPNKDQQAEIYQNAGEALSGKALEYSFKIKKLSSPVMEVANTQHVILEPADGEAKQSINERMVALGLCRVEAGVSKSYTRRGGGRRQGGGGWPNKNEKDYLDKVLKAETQARRYHKGMHVYGDVDSDNDED